MKKRIILILAAAIILSMVGCRTNGGETQPTETQAPTGQTTLPTQTETPTETDVPTETTAPVETTLPPDTAPPTQTTVPEETTPPTTATEPTEPSAPTESTEPKETTAPTQAPTEAPTENTQPEETTAPETKPPKNPNHSDEPDSSGSTKPTESTTPATEPAPEETTPPTTEEPATEPTTSNKPVVSTCKHTYKVMARREPTCTAKGTVRYVCSTCGKSYSEELPPTEHAYKDATCTAPKTCSTCGTTSGQPLGHNYADYTCTRCGAKDPAMPRTWTISISAKNGKPLENVTVNIYSDATLKELVATEVTDKYGVISLEMATAWTYHAVISGYDPIYTAEGSYKMSSDDLAIVLSSADDQDISGSTLKKGSTVSDFTVYDINGNRYNLTELLAEKKLVILNFWYVNCNPCKAEFPYIDAVYQKYSDQITLLAMDHYDGDSLAEIREIQESIGVSFPMVKELLGFDKALNITGYPTTVIIDSTGKIVCIETGGVTSEAEFLALIEPYL